MTNDTLVSLLFSLLTVFSRKIVNIEISGINKEKNIFGGEKTQKSKKLFINPKRGVHTTDLSKYSSSLLTEYLRLQYSSGASLGSVKFNKIDVI